MKHKILIIGTGSLLNYGCEAIVHGTYCILKRHFPKSEIYVASVDKEYDAKHLPSDIHIIKYLQRFTIYRIYKGILRRFLKIGEGSPVRMDTHIGTKFDIVLSCGGDNFCETPDGKIYTLLEDLMEIGANAVKGKKKYVLWGASVGPFKNGNNLKRVLRNLESANAIFLRERISHKYMQNFKSLELKSFEVADPAFCMEPDTTVKLIRKEGCLYVGLNFSQLAVSHVIGESDRDNFVSQMHNTLDGILEQNPNIIFVCVPHVVQRDCPAQDDIQFMGKYLKTTKFPERVEILPENIGARKTKGYISQMDMLVAARMHCCVGGISTGTPTLFLTYSSKGKGMAQYAYGHNLYDIDIKDFNSEHFTQTFSLMLNKRSEISATLKRKSKTFAEDAMRGGGILKDILA